MARHLPPEIWNQIALYIPSDELSDLIGVNRAFYELRMSARYRIVRVTTFDNTLVSKLRNLRNVTVAKHVHELQVSTAAFQTLEKGAKSRWKRLAMEYLSMHPARQRRAYPYAITSKPVHDACELLLGAAEQMRNIRSAFFNLLPKYPMLEYLPTLSRLWSSLSGRVRSLTLCVPVDVTHAIFSVFSDSPMIQHLSIIVSTPTHQWQTQTSWSISSAFDVANFVNSVAKPLLSLSLTLDVEEGPEELRSLFVNLLPLESLKRISLQVPFDDVLGAEVARFLNQHGNLLTELDFIPISFRAASVTPLSSLQLPLVHTLKLNLYSVHRSHRSHIQQFWTGKLGFSSLSSLTILCSLKPAGISLFCLAFRQSGFSQQITQFKLDAGLVNGQVFDDLATTFPRLHSLAIRSKYLSPLSCDWDAENLTLEMQHRRYPLWPIYDIKLLPSRSRSRPYPGTPSNAYVAMQAVAKCAPSVRSFCGSGNMEVPVCYMGTVESFDSSV